MNLLRTLSCLGLIAASSAPAAAAVVHDEGKTEVSVGALAQYAFEIENTGIDDETRIGSNLRTARIEANAVHHDVGTVSVEYDAAANQLLDAYVDISRNSPIGIRVGRFTTPVGAERQISQKDLRTPDRALLDDRVLRRATGLNVYADFDLGDVAFRADVGLFNPSLNVRVEDGQVLAQRLGLKFKGTYFHLAYATHVMGDNDLSNGGRLFPYEDQVDLAVGFDKAGLRVHAEGLVSFDPIISEDAVYSAYTFASLVIGDPKTGVAWEPVLAFDYEFSGDSIPEKNRVQVLVNVLWSERDLMTSFGVSRTSQDVNDEANSDLQGFFLVQGAI